MSKYAKQEIPSWVSECLSEAFPGTRQQEFLALALDEFDGDLHDLRTLHPGLLAWWTMFLWLMALANEKTRPARDEQSGEPGTSAVS